MSQINSLSMDDPLGVPVGELEEKNFYIAYNNSAMQDELIFIGTLISPDTKKVYYCFDQDLNITSRDYSNIGTTYSNFRKVTAMINIDVHV